MMTQSRISGLAVALLIVGWGCSSVDHRLGVEPEEATGSFVAPSADASDAEADSADASRQVVDYCPSNECPAGWGKCHAAQFDCEVDFSSDSSNCGECGKVCPELDYAWTMCVQGACRYQCKDRSEPPFVNWADCNGVVDDGCEVALGTNENCRFCGDTCDSSNPCIVNRDTGEGKCGCDPGLTLCGNVCVDLDTNIASCGACGNACDVTNGGTAPAHAGYGCQDGACGHLMCETDWGNCDGDWGNGCETNLTLEASCGQCDVQCSAGVHCVKDAFERNVCGCAEGLTYCDGDCVDLVHDTNNCGACENVCQFPAGELCMNGTCVMSCTDHHADCNASYADMCETNIWSDPHNCGGCGIECPGVGQACVFGTCAVAPCDESTPEAR